MDPNRANATEAELAVLESLWARETATIREITDELYPGGGAAQYATVQKLLERLESKGLVKRQRRRVPHRFRTAVDREGFISGRLQDLADTLCGGSMAPLLTQLLERGRYAPSEIEALKSLVERLDREQRGGGG